MGRRKGKFIRLIPLAVTLPWAGKCSWSISRTACSGRSILKDTQNYKAREFSCILFHVFAARKQDKAAPCTLFPEVISIMVTLLERKHGNLQEGNKSSA